MHGKTVGFFDYLTKAYGWTIKHVATPDGHWGSPEPPGPNRTFNGMIGMVQRQEVDMAACIITISHTRSQVVDFSLPYHYDAVRYMSHKPDYAPKRDVLIFPFSLNAWIAIVVAFFAFSILFYLIARLAGDQTYPLAVCAVECYKQYLGMGTDRLPAKAFNENGKVKTSRLGA